MYAFLVKSVETTRRSAAGSAIVVGSREGVRPKLCHKAKCRRLEKKKYVIYKKRGVAQLVARCVRDAKVVGSNPVASTKKCKSPFGVLHFYFYDNAYVAK